MDQRSHIHDYDIDDTTIRDLSILLGVVAAAFIAIGAMVYFFGEDQSAMSAANNPPAQLTDAPRAAPPTTTGQGGAR